MKPARSSSASSSVLFLLLWSHDALHQPRSCFARYDGACTGTDVGAGAGALIPGSDDVQLPGIIASQEVTAGPVQCIVGPKKMEEDTEEDRAGFKLPTPEMAALDNTFSR